MFPRQPSLRRRRWKAKIYPRPWFASRDTGSHFFMLVAPPPPCVHVGIRVKSRPEILRVQSIKFLLRPRLRLLLALPALLSKCAGETTNNRVCQDDNLLLQKSIDLDLRQHLLFRRLGDHLSSMLWSLPSSTDWSNKYHRLPRAWPS